MLRTLVCTTAVAAAVAFGGQALAQGRAPATPAPTVPPTSATPSSPAAVGTAAAPATQAAPAPAPQGGASTGPAAPAAPATGAAPSATPGVSVSAGLQVKDNTGAVIGQVTDVKADASGKQVAVIKMGADTFSVDTDKLAVNGGAASINATQAQLQSMIHGKAS